MYLLYIQICTYTTNIQFKKRDIFAFMYTHNQKNMLYLSVNTYKYVIAADLDSSTFSSWLGKVRSEGKKEGLAHPLAPCSPYSPGSVSASFWLFGTLALAPPAQGWRKVRKVNRRRVLQYGNCNLKS